MTATGIADLRIRLDDVAPAVTRRIEVPLTIRLDRLHLVLQAAMGWSNSHLYEIRAGDVGWGRPDAEFGDGPQDASKARLIDVLEDVGARSLTYLYDFGDGWEHSIRIGRITEAVPGIAYPRLVAAAGRCPPEDVGGPPGYREFLDAIADPDHPDHADQRDWIGGGFDPASVDADALGRAVESLARKWARQPASRPRR
ncbi:MAG: plasmid pRiA4b ORF-3 family protein [Acetobacteraceae bacterium]